MKILVFDDSELHRRAAEVLLAGHNLTVVGTYEEAEKALSQDVDHEKAEEILRAEFGDFNPYKEGATEEQKKAYFAAMEKAVEASRNCPDFDAVLTDLLVPASRKAQGPEGKIFVGQEMPLGSIIALRALAAGVTMVAVVTYMNHHNHPASAALDNFFPFSIGDTKVICTNHATTCVVDAETLQRVSYKFVKSEEGEKKYPVNRNYHRDGLIYVKAWDEILAQLQGESA
jgi:DNA-binding NarL/FixJ family response regulator